MIWPTAVDLFAGAGGLDLAAEAHGIDVLGIELDPSAVATRKAAGLNTLMEDVARLDPLDFQGITGLMGGPPCPTFSMAGKGSGRDDLSILRRALYKLGRDDPSWTATAAECSDPRTRLVLEPLRWAQALMPDWIVLEQVPPVLPVWDMTAIALQGLGYNVWTGILHAEQYGVPQTRKRALLLAARGRLVQPPPPTHQRFNPRHPRSESLCGTLRPWVSMAEALGWAGAPLVGFPRLHETPSRSGGAGRAVELGGVLYRDRDLRSAELPAQNVTGKARSWTLHTNRQPNATQRRGDQPAPTIKGGHDTADRRFVLEEGAELVMGTGANAGRRTTDEPAPTVYFGARLNTVAWLNTGRDWQPGQDRDSAQKRSVDHPAPAITGADTQARWEGVKLVSHQTIEGGPRAERNGEQPAVTVSPGTPRGGKWVGERPATTVAGDDRLHPPGHKINAEDVAAGRTDYEGRAGQNAVRLEIWEAAVLQSFPPDYPWQGSRTKQYQQIGNAVPPLLAYAALGSVVAPR